MTGAWLCTDCLVYVATRSNYLFFVDPDSEKKFNDLFIVFV